MIHMFNTGTNNTDRMVISHGPSNPTWGLQYQDVGDKFNFIRVGSPVLTIDLGASNVGVGTFSPNFYSGTGRFLSVSSTSAYANAPAVLELQGSMNGMGVVSKIDFSSLFTPGSPTNTARIALLNNGSIFQGELSFSTHNGTSLSEAMRINSTGDVGIGTTAPSAALHVVGSTRLVDGTQGADKVLKSDATGNATWVNSSINTGFGVYTTATQTVASGSWTQVNFNSEDFDDGADFAANQYVCPSSGVYQFDAGISWWAMANTTGYTFVGIYRNGVQEKTRMTPSHTNFHSNNISASIKCVSGDVITIRVLQTQGVTESIYGSGNDYTYFTGHRVY